MSDPRAGPDPGPGPRFARNRGRSPVPVPDFSKSGTTAATVAGSSSSCRLVALLLRAKSSRRALNPRRALASGCTRASSHQALLGYCLERGPCGIVTVGALGGQTLTRNEASDGSSCHSTAQLIMSDLPVQTSPGMRGGSRLARQRTSFSLVPVGLQVASRVPNALSTVRVLVLLNFTM